MKRNRRSAMPLSNCVVSRQIGASTTTTTSRSDIDCANTLVTARNKSCGRCAVGTITEIMLIRESVGLAKQRAQAPRLLLAVGFNFLKRRWSTPFGNKRHHYYLHIQQKCVSIRLRAK